MAKKYILPPSLVTVGLTVTQHLVGKLEDEGVILTLVYRRDPQTGKRHVLFKLGKYNEDTHKGLVRVYKDTSPSIGVKE